MACLTPFHSPPFTMLATSTTAGSPVWLTEFQPTAGLTHIDAVVTPTDAQGNARVQLVVAFAAADPASPSAPVAVGSATATQAKVTADVSSAASSNGSFPARQFSTVAAVMKTLGKESATSGSVKTRLMSRVFEKDLSEPGA